MSARTGIAIAAIGLLLATGTAQAAVSCDRECLIGIADGNLAAIAVHDPAKASFAANVRFVENVKRLKPGEGIWAAAAGKATSFRIYVPDPVQGSVGLITLIDRKGANGAFAGSCTAIAAIAIPVRALIVIPPDAIAPVQHNAARIGRKKKISREEREEREEHEEARRAAGLVIGVYVHR